jgi:hypothetical protein
MKPASQITDRAKRYRAHRNPPPGPKRCNFCASRRNVDIDHISGNEAEGEQENLIWLCRSCNSTKAVIQARNRIGVRTAQYNPQENPGFSAFVHAAAVLLGLRKGNAGEATRTIRNTAPATRAGYAARMAKNPAPDFQQYVFGVTHHQRGAHDEGGAIIHATPPTLRRRYALEIASLKRQRGTGTRRTAADEVPF